MMKNTRAITTTPTIGLIMCNEKSEAVVKYSVVSDKKQLFASKYLPYLPSEDELKRILMGDGNG